jgi:hypothetical protein
MSDDLKVLLGIVLGVLTAMVGESVWHWARWRWSIRRKAKS